MDWTEVAIYTTTDGIEAVTGSLMQLGINGFVIEDAQDFQAFLNDTTVHWDYVEEELMRLKDCETCVKVYLAQNEQGSEQLSAIRQELARLQAYDTQHRFGRLQAELRGVSEEDWANNWKQYFKPFPVGERLLVKPTWENCGDPQGRIVLEIDPGASFGTGQHNTTQLCLEQLERWVKPGDRVLDMGCGSGILSIAALLLGARQALGVDIDQNSVRVARENAEKNRIEPERLDVLCGNVISDPALRQRIGSRCYDVIAANIVADVIIAMSPILPDFLKPGGVLVASGIIEGRYQEVLDALEQHGFAVVSKSEKSEWVALVCRQK